MRCIKYDDGEVRLTDHVIMQVLFADDCGDGEIIHSFAVIGYCDAYAPPYTGKIIYLSPSFDDCSREYFFYMNELSKPDELPFVMEREEIDQVGKDGTEICPAAGCLG